MRNLGLDMARSLAILMVLVSHSRMFFTKFGDVQSLSFNGLLGVELFFVLSGFLIGGIIIRDLIEGNGSLIQFYSRRWLRTLPAYFLVLSIVILIAVWNHQKWFYQHFLFIQNFNYEQLGFFGVSWSLSIEEWFYLLTPPCLLILTKLGKANRKTLFFVFCISVILLSVVAKIIYTYQYNPPWDAGIRKQIFLRMDSLMFGVMLAGIKYYFKPFYERVSSAHLFWVSLAMVVSIVLYYVVGLDGGRDRINHSIIGRTILFDAISIAFMLMIWSLEKSKRINDIQGSLRKICTFLAVTSYSVYLIHLEIFSFVNRKVESVYSIPTMFLVLFSTLVTVFILAYGLHRYWEKPFMNLREKRMARIGIPKNNSTI
ncbi:acyltransferase family protein [Paenibacillus ehimensis]|uniref:acyltransferase family protein n=1 Tax=Paenibacillus ehimensis TaxID=79264 RepID=UPI000FD7806B|nr:acyltransferase [Paenibacillus ehimensis]